MAKVTIATINKMFAKYPKGLAKKVPNFARLLDTSQANIYQAIYKHIEIEKLFKKHGFKIRRHDIQSNKFKGLLSQSSTTQRIAKNTPNKQLFLDLKKLGFSTKEALDQLK